MSALVAKAAKGRAALTKLAASLARAHMEPTADHALVLLEVAHAAKESYRGVVWCDGELRELGLRLGARILAASGDVARLLSLEDALGAEPVWRLVLQTALGHDGWSSPPEPYLASDLDAQQRAIVRTLAERKQKPLGVFATFGLFAADRLVGLTPPGPRDAAPTGEPLWRMAWRCMRAGSPDAAWEAALAHLDHAERVALALDLLALREGAAYPPVLERSYGENGRYATGRNRLVAATLSGVPADLVAPHITRTDLAWTQAPLVFSWVRALVAEGRPVPLDADPILRQVLERLDDDPTIARTLVSALPLERREAVAGALELNHIVSDDRPRAARAAFFRLGWHVVDLVPSLRARALALTATWQVDPLIAAGAAERLRT